MSISNPIKDLNITDLLPIQWDHETAEQTNNGSWRLDGWNSPHVQKAESKPDTKYGMKFGGKSGYNKSELIQLAQ